MKKKTKSKNAEPKQKAKESNDSDYYYTKEEEKRIDEFHKKTENKFTDEEIYELMLKYKDNDEEILNELKEQLKERKRGEEYEWQTIGKSKIIFNYIF